jgi:hypothetical protein
MHDPSGNGADAPRVFARSFLSCLRDFNLVAQGSGAPKASPPTASGPSGSPARAASHGHMRWVASARLVPTWDTLETSNLVDFLFEVPRPQGPNRPLLWLFATDRLDAPMVSDLWLQNGMEVALPHLRVSLRSTELRMSTFLDDAEDLIYSDVLPGEAVRVEALDTLAEARKPRALWFEVATPDGGLLRLSAGPNRWESLPVVLLRA